MTNLGFLNSIKNKLEDDMLFAPNDIKLLKKNHKMMARKKYLKTCNKVKVKM